MQGKRITITGGAATAFAVAVFFAAIGFQAVAEANANAENIKACIMQGRQVETSGSGKFMGCK